MTKLTKDVASQWSKQEFSTADIGDERLNNRLKLLAQNTLVQPHYSINQAEEDAAATKAAYRFYANEKVTPDTIYAPHVNETKKRMNEYDDVLLALQDTTFYNYSGHLTTEGLGKIGRGGKGLIQHHSFIVTPEGLPLGTLSHTIWSRVTQATPQKQLVPLEEKESYKWFEAMRDCELNKPKGSNLVHVSDRESDIAELYLHAQTLNAQFVIRGNWDRELDCEEHRLSELYQDLDESIDSLIQVPAKRGGYPKRNAKLTIKYSHFEFMTPEYLQDYKGISGTVPMWVVYAVEETPPAGVERISWVLLTNVAVTNFEEALTRVGWYQKRWLIEVYHKTIKSNCQVEDCRLADAEKLSKYIALNSVVAWRIMWMTYLARIEPELPCSYVLTPAEWKTLYCRIKRTTTLPKKLPTVRQVVRWMAQMGGYLARKRDPEPGIIAICRGWIRIQDSADLWIVMNSK